MLTSMGAELDSNCLLGAWSQTNAELQGEEVCTETLFFWQLIPMSLH